jgi:TfoX/Sxy family transcriptional regulator of competence genes
MAADPATVERLREWFAERGVTDERRMFGGVAFLDAGRMVACGNSHGELMVRCDPALTAELAEADGVAPMEMKGRPVKGWLEVERAVVADDADLDVWLSRALEYARTLPVT